MDLDQSIMAQVFDSLPDALFALSLKKRVFLWNKTLEEMTGVMAKDILGKSNYSIPFYGKPTTMLVDVLLDETKVPSRYHKVSNMGGSISAEVFAPCLYNGKGSFLWVLASKFYDNKGKVCGAIKSIRNISQQKQVEESLHLLSNHDRMTGLFNRAFFEDELDRLEKKEQCSLGMIACDINGLKYVNKNFGNNEGDKLVKATAGILKNAARKDDTIVRTDGDEFAVIKVNCTYQCLEKTCHKIREGVLEYNSVNYRVPLSLSLGFSFTDKKTSESASKVYEKALSNMCRQKLHQDRSAQSAVVNTLLKALEARDFITEGHADRLQYIVTAVAKKLGLSEERIADLRLFAKFHDIGKIGIPDSILFKEAELNSEEFTIMKSHCNIGYTIASVSPDLEPISEWILKHHEWWNGKGYPFGLKGEEIPLECRILAIADAYDAMTSKRPYKNAISNTEAIRELERKAGSQFDPYLTKIFLEVIKKGW